MHDAILAGWLAFRWWLIWFAIYSYYVLRYIKSKMIENAKAPISRSPVSVGWRRLGVPPLAGQASVNDTNEPAGPSPDWTVDPWLPEVSFIHSRIPARGAARLPKPRSGHAM